MSFWLYKKPNSRKWWARIKVPGRKPFARSTGTTVERTAERVAERHERDALVQGAPVTLQEALTAWHAEQRAKGDSAHTLEITERTGGHLVGFFGRRRDVRTIEQSETLKYWVARRAFVKDATIAKELRTLLEALRALRRAGRYDADPARLWPPGLPHSFPSRKRWLPQAEWRKLYVALPAKWRDALVALSFAGMRLSEGYGVQLRMVSFDERRLYAPGTKTEGAARWIPLHPEVEALARRRLALAGPDAPLLALDGADYQVTRHRLHSALRRAARKARIEHVTANDLRRTFASWCYQADVPEADCVRWLGHASAKMVREVYAHDSAENAARKLDAVPSILVSPPVSPDATPSRGTASSGETE